MDPTKQEQILSKIEVFIQDNPEIESTNPRLRTSKILKLYHLMADEISTANLEETERVQLYKEFIRIYRDRVWTPTELRLTGQVEPLIDKAHDIGGRIRKQFAEKFIGDSEAFNRIKYTPNLLGKTASEQGGIITYEGKKYYVKPCKHDEQLLTKIDANELFIYKFLELIGLGPKVKFLPTQLSSSVSGHYKGYIVTEDIADSEKSKFYLDVFSEGDDESIKEVWRQAIADEKFLIEFLALSLIDDIAIINDSLSTNPENYGILEDSQAKSFHARIIDFYPNTNRKISFRDGKSVLQILIDKLEISSDTHSRNHKEVLSLALLKSGKFDEKTIADGVNKFLSKLNILDNLREAFEYVKGFIDDPRYTDSFNPDALSVLNKYASRILAKFNEAKESGIPIIEHIPLHIYEYIGSAADAIGEDDQDKAKTPLTLSLSNFEQFLQEQHGITVYSPPGDGHCFYHAVAHQIANTTSAELQNVVMHHILTHQDQYQAFFDGGIEGFQQYVDQQFVPGTWADNVIIQALADSLGINISVLQSDAFGNINHVLITPNPDIYIGSAVGTVSLINLNNWHFYSISSITEINLYTHPEVINIASQIGISMEPEFDSMVANFNNINISALETYLQLPGMVGGLGGEILKVE